LALVPFEVFLAAFFPGAFLVGVFLAFVEAAAFFGFILDDRFAALVFFVAGADLAFRFVGASLFLAALIAAPDSAPITVPTTGTPSAVPATAPATAPPRVPLVVGVTACSSSFSSSMFAPSKLQREHALLYAIVCQRQASTH
jgi:hypothetical protein